MCVKHCRNWCQARYYGHGMQSLIKDCVCMKFYNETKSLHLETDASGIGLGLVLLQTRDGATCPRDILPDNTILRPFTFARKSLNSMEQGYSNMEREALGILCGLERFHHYCFAREVSIITDYMPLVAIFKKDVATLSQRIQPISSGYTNSESEYYTSLYQIFSSQTCFPDITIQRTKMQKYMAWI